MKKKIAAICAILALIILLPAALFFQTATTAQPPQPSNGVLDLSNWSFEKNGMVSLAGTWSFYFNRFLTHDDFVRDHDLLPAPASLQIPSTAKSMAEVKPFADNKFYGTLRLVIKLPEGRQTYGLRTDIILTSFKLYIDGHLQGEVGKVGTSGENSLPYYNILTAYFSPESNEVELIYHTADFTAQDCSMAAPKIGLAAQISQREQLGLGRDLFLFGMLLIMAIYHVGLYIMRTKDRAPLYFGVFCLLFALRMLLVGERFLPSHLQLSFFAYGRMAYLSVFIAFSALCGFLYYALDGLLARWFMRVSVAQGLLSAVFILFVPYSSADRILMVSAVPGVVLLSYALLRLGIGAWQGFPFARVVLLGFAVLGATFVNDFIYQITLANTPSLIPLGVAVFTFTQAYTLSARFSGAFTRAEQLTVENKAILADLTYMNTKLESLVQERTADLEKALKEMEVMSKTDYLTKLPNRRLVFAKIKELIEQKKDFYICLADIDHFKEINDQYGHVKGDEVLVLLSAILTAAIGGCGFVGRWGGEEFLIVLETAHLDSILDKCNEIRRAVAEYRYPGIGRGITMTFGLCQYRENTSLDVQIAMADEALYRGKIAGRNRCLISA